MKSLIFTFCIFFSLKASAQFLSVDWGYSLGGAEYDRSYKVATDTAGNLIIVGIFQGTVDFDPGPATFNLSSPTGKGEFFLAKFDPAGNFLWAKNLFSIWDGAREYRMELDSDNNIFLAGSFRGTVDFDPGPAVFNLSSSDPNQLDLYAVKLDEAGNFLWANQTNGKESGIVRLSSIATDPMGNLYASGVFYGMIDLDTSPDSLIRTAGFRGDSYIQKWGPQGDFLWGIVLEGENTCSIYEIETDFQGNIVATGIFGETQDFDPGPNSFPLSSTGNSSEIFTMKLAPDGSFLWAGQIASPVDNMLANLAIDQQGNVYIGGIFHDSADFDPGSGADSLTSSNNGEWVDFFIQKLDNQGNLVWAKKIVTENDAFKETGLIKISPSGHVYVVGEFYGTADFDHGPAPVQLSAPGNTRSTFVARYTPSGRLVWAHQIDGDQDEMNKDFVLDKEESIYLTGGIEHMIDFDPNPTNFLLNTTGQAPNIYLVKWAQDTCLGSAVSPALDITVVQRNDTLIAQETNASYQWVDCDNQNMPIVGATQRSFQVGNIGNFAVRLSRGSCSSTSDCVNVSVVGNSSEFRSELRFYPNPTTGRIYVELGDFYPSIEVEILNSLGQTISHYQVSHTEKIRVQLPTLKGMYFVNVKAAGRNASLKVVKE